MFSKAEYPTFTAASSVPFCFTLFNGEHKHQAHEARARTNRRPLHDLRHDETASNAMHLEKIKNSTSDKRLHEEQDMGKGASENPKVLQHRHHCVR